MKNERLLRIIGEIDDRHIAEAAPTAKKDSKNQWVKWAAVAACLCLAVIGILNALNSGLLSGKAGTASTAEPSESNQVLLIKNTAGDEHQDPIHIQLVSTKQGLCLPNDSEVPAGTIPREIAVNVAPSESPKENTGMMSLDDAKKTAYLDYDSASEELKERILEARSIIIFNSNWVADGYSGCIQNVETGEIIETLPSFSELFPGWDMPEYNYTDEQITEDGLGVDCLYGIQMIVLQVKDSFVICSSQEQMNMFGADQTITIFPPERTPMDTLGLKAGDTIFVSYFGKDCSVSNCTIQADTIELN